MRDYIGTKTKIKENNPVGPVCCCRSQINKTSFPGNMGGLEDGVVVRRADGGFSMIAAEMYANPHWIAMRVGVYTSRDGLHWDKQRTLRQSTGKFDGSE